MSDHNDAVERISNQFKKKGFQVQTTGNNLPEQGGRTDALYRPDIIVRNSEDQIAWLVEVETSEGGKAVAGAAILADICMEKMKVKGRPKLLFVFYRPESNLQLAEKRLRGLKSRINNLEIMLPLSETVALKQISGFTD